MIETIVRRHSPAVRSHLPNRSAWSPVLPSIEPHGAPAEGEIHKRVLVVDDENLIADSIAEILNRNGFDAVARYDAESVMHLVTEAPCPDMMLMDVVMPRFSGIELAKAVRSVRPAIRILLLSGNVATSRMLNDASAEGFLFEILAKPVHPSRLLKLLSA